MNSLKRPEILAPAGDPDAMRAAIDAGADAVYLGLPKFNARARADNFAEESLLDTVNTLHARGVRAYVTLNTLVFDSELDALTQAIRTCAHAGVDAVIVQDLGVAALVRAIAPTLPIHASTQMTCTDAASVQFASELGASRVILARELSLSDIAAIRRETDVELEVFVHGALCIAYSGQCLTSEAIGGRSANRGACAQACRLPYELVVDGQVRALSEMDERAFLLSPQDLEASELVPQLAALGVCSLKIEGRLKGAPYVAATTRLYRDAVDHLGAGEPSAATQLRDDALQTFSRGSGQGFFNGVDHQRLVEGRGCDHRGLEVATLHAVPYDRGRLALSLTLTREIRRGDGLLVEGKHAGEGELGGRVWSIVRDGASVESAPAGSTVLVSFGPDRALDPAHALVGHRVFRNDDPHVERKVLDAVQRSPRRFALDLVVRGSIGEFAHIIATTDRGHSASVALDQPLEPARNASLDEATLRDKLGRLGDTMWSLRTLTSELGEGLFVAPAALNRARRALVESLVAQHDRAHPITEITGDSLRESLVWPTKPHVTEPSLFVLCRTLGQAHAALDAGASGITLDFLELTGTGTAVRALRARGPVHITLAPPRIRKPGEEKIEKYLASLKPDAVLIRSLGALRDWHPEGVSRIGDFSLNATNQLTASALLAHGLTALTPSFDLDAQQLYALLQSPFGPHAELVVHHPMPLFHMEHCVIAATLSEGRDHHTCGRPCDTHKLSLRDRAGIIHPIEADVGCRNTVFHGAAQSAAGVMDRAQTYGVSRFRIELVRESADDVARIVEAYRGVLASRISVQNLYRTLKTEGHYGVVRGSLRVLNA
ncbi:MAG: U32 family peptidase [Deltaproteobacteria bacterium]|nr:U32 family peptidase [Deltaproteobacteria bacterium]